MNINRTLSIVSALVAASLACLPGANAEVPAAIKEAVAESGGYELIYELEIPEVNEFGGDSFSIEDAYSVNKSEDGATPFSRIAYVMELDDEWVWVSFDSFTDDLSLIGIPHMEAHPSALQRRVSNLNVFSNVDDGERLSTGRGFDGNIEFWGGNYAQANAAGIPNADDATFDFGDTMAGDGGHGCMQVHNFVEEDVVFAYNNWGSNNSGSPGGLGIGTNPDGNPDYTFAGNSESYETRKLYVLVQPGVPVPDAIASAVPEAKDYELVYHVEIPSENEWVGDAANIEYTVDNSAVAGEFDRVAYLIELDDEWVWVSFDSYTTARGETGVPVMSVHAEPLQQIVTKMNVFSNADAAKIATGSFDAGNIEFWGGNYGGGNALNIPNATDAFDFGDTMSAGGHGSMQIHNHLESQVIFAYNNWGSNNAGATGGLGFGTFDGDNPDWTFAGSSQSYEKRNLWVLVRAGAPPNLSLPKFAAASASLSGDRIALQFDEPLAESSAAVGNFSIEGLAVTAASLSGDTIILTTAPQTAGTSYTVTYSAISDVEGNTLPEAKSASVTAPAVPALPGTIPEAAGYELIYYVEIPATAPAWGSSVPYLIDETLFSSTETFGRVAYIMELDDQWVFVSFDTIAAAKEVSKVGVPTLSVIDGAPIQTQVGNMDVVTNIDDTDIIQPGTGLTGGNIEFWPSNYSQGNAIGIPDAEDGIFDFGDGGASASVGYGSMQVHNHEAQQVIFAFNRWGGGGAATDIGIGNNLDGENPDYTFAANGENFEKRNLYVLVLSGDLPDLTPVAPKVIGTTASLAGDQIAVQFDQPMGASAGDPANYTVAGLTITAATLDAETNQVLLTTSPMVAGQDYSLALSDVITEIPPGTQSIEAGTTVAYTAPAFPDLGAMPTGGFELIYHLEIPETGPLNTGVPYAINESFFKTAAFPQVAYGLVLDDEWVFVSFDAHSDDLEKIGVPTKSVGNFQQIVTNLKVDTNVDDTDRITPGTYDQGNIEFWGWNYGGANANDIPNADGAAFDWGDVRAADGGYGSLQVHNHEVGEVILAYNRWGDTADISDLGIGTNIDGQNPDYTFQQNAADYENRNLYVFVGAPGAGTQFQITDFVLNEAGDQATVTWTSRPGASYLAESSTNLEVWAEIEDGIPSGGETTTFPFPITAGTREIYFRVEQQ